MNLRLPLLLLALVVPDLASAAPAAWTVDKATSSLKFSSSMGGEAFSGVFRSWAADIRFDPADLAHSSVAVTVDVASANTANSDRDQALPTPAFFNAPAFPKATYVARSFTAAGPNRYVAAGVLTLRGVAKPLTLPFTLVITGPAARMSGQVAINRLAFGVGQNEWKATTTLPAAVQLTIALNAKRGDIAAAAAALIGGGLVIMPTETVYGLAARAADPAAVARLFEAKGRPRFNPLIAHVGGVAQAREIAGLDDRAEALIAAFWPGPLTIVAPYRGGAAVCDLARAGLDTVALRAPAHPVARALLAAVGESLVAPSANRSGRPSPTTHAAAVEETGASAAVALDGGPCAIGLESTVVSLLDGPARLLRPGSVTRAEIEALIGPLAEAEADAGRSPGRMARHYAPEAPVRLGVTEPLDNEIYLGFGAGPDTAFNLSPSGDPREAAANLFDFLRRADVLSPAAIAVAPIPFEGLGEAINDRLARAAGKVG